NRMSETPPSQEDSLATFNAWFTASYRKIRELTSVELCRHVIGDKKEDVIDEVAPVVWDGLRKLALQGRDYEAMLPRAIEFACKRVRSGRNLTNSNPLNDVLSDTARF